MTRGTGSYVCAGALLCVLLSGCDPHPGRVLVVVDSDLAVPAELGAVRAVIVPAGGALQQRDFVVRRTLEGPHMDPEAIPLSFAVESDGDGGDFEVRVSGHILPDASDEPVVTRRAVTGFIPGRTLVLPMPLLASCRGVVCEADETCDAGVCVAARVAPETLREVDAPGHELPDAGTAQSGAYVGAHIIGGAGDDRVFDVALAPSGHLIVAGTFLGTFDFGGGPRTSGPVGAGYVVSYAPDGSWVFDRVLDGASHERLAVDASGNVFVTGSFTGTVEFQRGARTSSGGTIDAYVVSYDEAGANRFDVVVGGAALDDPEEIAADAAGRSYVVGRFDAATDIAGPQPWAGGTDVFVLALDPDGTVAYVRVLGGPGLDVPSGVVVDPAGTAFVGGHFEGTVDFGRGARTAVGSGDAFVVSLNASGAPLFDRTFGTAGNDVTDQLARDAAGEVHLFGRFSAGIDFGGGARSADGPTDAMEVVLGPDLAYRSDVQRRSTSDLVVRSVAFDATGNQFRVGNVVGDHDFGGGVVPGAATGGAYMVSYAPGGVYRLARIFFPAGPTANTYANGVAIGPAGDLWVGGVVAGTSIDLGGGPLTTMSQDGFLVHLRD